MSEEKKKIIKKVNRKLFFKLSSQKKCEEAITSNYQLTFKRRKRRCFFTYLFRSQDSLLQSVNCLYRSKKHLEKQGERNSPRLINTSSDLGIPRYDNGRGEGPSKYHNVLLSLSHLPLKASTAVHCCPLMEAACWRQ